MDAMMTEFKASKGFIDDIVKLARFCDENDTDSMEICFTLNDGSKAVVELTFRGEQND